MLFNRFALKDARKRQKKTLTALGKASGHSVPYMSQIETGARSSPSIEAVEAWSAELDIEPRVLYIEPTFDELLREVTVQRAKELKAAS